MIEAKNFEDSEKFLTAKSAKAEICAALKSQNVALNHARAQKFIPAFRRAAKNLLKKWKRDSKNGEIRTSLAALMNKHGMTSADKIPASLAAAWAQSMTAEKHAPRLKALRPDPLETAREENQRYWTKRMQQTQRGPK